MSGFNPVRFGILGCAEIARKNIRATLGSAAKEFCIVTAVASRSLEKAKNFIAENFPEGNSVNAYGSYEELLESPDIDAVYIPLPTTLHLKYATMAAANGKHAILEKPCALNVDELATITNAFREKRLVFMDGTMFMHNPRLNALTDLLNTTSHSIQQLSSTFCFNANKDFLRGNIRASSSGDPLGALGDLGWYCTRFALLAFSISDLAVGASTGAVAGVGAMGGAGGGSGGRTRAGSLTSQPPEDTDVAMYATSVGNVITMPTHVSATCSMWGGEDSSVPLDCHMVLYFAATEQQPQPRTCRFDLSFVSPFKQKIEINCVPWMDEQKTDQSLDAADMIITCDDFVIPRVPETSKLTVERFQPGVFALGDFSRRVTSVVSDINVNLDCTPQEERMFIEFSKLVHNSSAASRSSRGDDEAVHLAACSMQDRNRWSNWALATQAVVDRAYISMKQDGAQLLMGTIPLY